MQHKDSAGRTKIVRKLLFTWIAFAVGSGSLFSQEKLSPTAPTQPASSAKQSTNSAANKAKVISDFPIIGHIEKQNRTITIKAGSNGTIYSVRSADGKLVCDNLTLEQLRAQAPELHEFVKTAVAGNLSNGASADSRLRVTDGRASGTADGRIR